MTLARDVVRFGDHLPTTVKSYAKIPQIMEMPNLIKVQLDSYDWFIREGLRELLDEISPIQDFTGSKMELRVVVSQLVRSPGVYFTRETDPTTGRGLAYAKVIPNRGAWLEFETSNRDVISVKVDRKRKIPVTTLLRAIGYGNDEELLDLFKEV